jgi:hypothetical protein
MHNNFLIKLPKQIEYIFMHLCHDFVSPKLSGSDANIISLGWNSESGYRICSKKFAACTR